MAIKPKRQLNERRSIDPWVIYFLIHGHVPKDAPEINRYSAFQLESDAQRQRNIWDDVKSDLLKKFIKDHPCCRPWAWWKLDTPERRQQTGGSGDGWTPGMAMDYEGLPKYWQLDWNKENPPTFESEAAYLERHGLLSPVERGFLTKHSELLEPELIEFDES